MIKITGIKETMKSLRESHKIITEAGKKKEMLLLVEELKAATPVDTGEARDGWKSDGKSIINEVEHIASLNDGSSTQAPARFIEKTVLAHEGVHPSGIIVLNT